MHQKMTPMIEYCWAGMLEVDVRSDHPLRRAQVTIRKYEDRTFEHEDTIHVVTMEPFVYFVIKTPSRFDALPLTEGVGTYQVEAKALPGGDYPIEAGLYEVCINGKPAYDRLKKTFHPLLELP